MSARAVPIDPSPIADLVARPKTASPRRRSGPSEARSAAPAIERLKGLRLAVSALVETCARAGPADRREVDTLPLNFLLATLACVDSLLTERAPPNAVLNAIRHMEEALSVLTRDSLLDAAR